MTILAPDKRVALRYAARVHGRVRGFAVAMSLMLGHGLACSSTAPDGIAGPRAAQPPIARDAGVRVKERLVAIELPPIGHRTFQQAADGSFDWGETQPIDGAESCVVQRPKTAPSPDRRIRA